MYLGHSFVEFAKKKKINQTNKQRIPMSFVIKGLSTERYLVVVSEDKQQFLKSHPKC